MGAVIARAYGTKTASSVSALTIRSLHCSRVVRSAASTQLRTASGMGPNRPWSYRSRMSAAS